MATPVPGTVPPVPATLQEQAAAPARSPGLSTPPKAVKAEDVSWWKPGLAFGLGLTASWAAIAILWSITPLCYLYVLWTLITLAPALQAGRPARSGALQVVHYVVLSYCILEIPFSIYYRYLAFRAQKLRPTPVYTRRYLRNVFQHSLENGMREDGFDDDLLDVLALTEAPAREVSRESGRGVVGDALHGIQQFQMPASIQQNLDKIHLPESIQHNLGKIQMPELRIPDLHLPSMRHRKSTVPLTPDLDLGELPLPTVSSLSSTNMVPSSSQNTLTAKSFPPSFIERPMRPEDPRAKDFQEYLRVWFSKAEFDQIYRLNMCDWLAWSLYGQPYEDLLSERDDWEKAGKPTQHIDGKPDLDEEGLEIEGSKSGLVDHCVDMVEARAARTFPPGRNPNVKAIRLTLDPVRVMSRPLILYGFVWALQNVMIGNAKRHGFKQRIDGDQGYLIRIPDGWKPDRSAPESQQPLLFVHGLGMGMAQYATLLNHLATSPTLKDRPIFILVQPHISMSFFSKGYLHPPNQATCTANINRISKKYGFDKSGMTVLSHSNGTIVHGWLCKSCPELINRSCFVDPVCFCLWEPWVCYNFLYSACVTPIQFLMRYFVSRELGVALMLQREFDWSSNLLFPHQIPNLLSPYHSAIYLAQHDAILNPDRVRQYIVRAGVQEVPRRKNVGEGRGGLKVHTGKKHGESMIGSGRAFEQIMAWVTCEPGELPGGSSNDDTESI